MKKILLTAICLLPLAACNNTVDLKPDAAKLTRLTEEPTNCKFLYDLDSSARFYSEADAVRFMENQIAERGGNSYWMKTMTTTRNEWTPFAPVNTFTMNVKVYQC